MNRNFKVIQIHGLSGLMILGFILTGLFCGFVIFPIWVVMVVWNSVVADIMNGPVINYFQALLLWSAVILSLYLLLKNSISVKIQREEAIDLKEMKNIISDIKEKEIDEIQESEEIKK